MSVTLDYIDGMRHGVVSSVGRGKSGKSQNMYTILDSCPRLVNRPKAFYRFPRVDLFPSYFDAYEVQDFDDVDNGSILVIEDVNRVFPSRASWNPELQEYLGIISHKEVLIFTTGQNTASGDMAFYRDQDLVTIHKLMDPLGIKFERAEFRDICLDANDVIMEASQLERVHPVFVSYVPRFGEVLVLENPPEWYGYEISHALRNAKVRPEPKGGSR